MMKLIIKELLKRVCIGSRLTPTAMIILTFCQGCISTEYYYFPWREGRIESAEKDIKIRAKVFKCDEILSYENRCKLIDRYFLAKDEIKEVKLDEKSCSIGYIDLGRIVECDGEQFIENNDKNSCFLSEFYPYKFLICWEN